MNAGTSLFSVAALPIPMPGAASAGDALPLPTLAEAPRTERAGIEDGLRDVLEKEPRGTIDRRAIRIAFGEAFGAGPRSIMVHGPTAAGAASPAAHERCSPPLSAVEFD